VNLLLRNARIASESSPDLLSADVLIVHGVIEKIAKGIAAPDGAKVIDCKNQVLCPAFFDAHVHFREPGQEHKENIASGSESAINGGITGIVMMPNTSPSLDSGASVSAVRAGKWRESTACAPPE
jgi:dihydroorotase